MPGMFAFTSAFRADLADLLRWRRDVRHFRADPVDEAVLMRCLDTFCTAPSVGLSQPWRLMHVSSATARAAACANFEIANTDALAGYESERAALYAGLKLSGMRDAPVHLAVWCDETTEKGAGLGARTMPEMRRYSVVCAITQFWLAARAEGLGVGWVSILDPVQMARDLDAPPEWHLIAYLCVGWPAAPSLTPELETAGWETRAPSLPVWER